MTNDEWMRFVGNEVFGLWMNTNGPHRDPFNILILDTVRDHTRPGAYTSWHMALFITMYKMGMRYDEV